MSGRKGGLGKGLDALIPGEGPTGGNLLNLPVDQIRPNPRQPRAEFDPEEMESLALSIREHGILQPLVVAVEPGLEGYTLIAGERRLRAAVSIGLKMVPALIRPVSEQERLELALIENLQRADLAPLETAEAYSQLADEFGLLHEEIAARVGKSRAAVTNTLRLLKLAPEVKDALREGKISEGHARALLGLGAAAAQVTVLKTVIERELNVRQTEELVKKLAGERPTRKPRATAPPELQDIENRLLNALGTRVTLRKGRKGGSLTIYYFSDEELDALVSRFTGE